MTNERSDIAAAVSLMKMALTLVDKAGETGVAVHLQHTINLVIKTPIPRTNKEAEEMLDTQEARILFDSLGFAK